MNFDTCFNCGEPGHFASTCPAGTTSQPPSWRPGPRRPDQDRINEAGIALVRAALAATNARLRDAADAQAT